MSNTTSGVVTVLKSAVNITSAGTVINAGTAIGGKVGIDLAGGTAGNAGNIVNGNPATSSTAIRPLRRAAAPRATAFA